MIKRQLKVEIDREFVLRQIDCYEESDLYEEIIEEYEGILADVYSLCNPVFIMDKGVIGPELAREELPEGTPVLMVLSSIGKGISEYSTNAFAEGDYLKGMLSDAMADSALFSLEKEFTPLLKEACAEYQMGIKRRLEAPQDISMEAQKVVWEKTNALQLCGIRISTGYMLDPVKSNVIIYVLTDNVEDFRHQHDCLACNRYDCKMRNIPDVPVKAVSEEKVYLLQVKEKESVLDALMRADSSFSAICGGHGKCGKCKIKLEKGYLPVTEADKRCFSKEQLKQGMRLSCKAFPIEPLEIRLKFYGEEKFQVLDKEQETVTNNKQFPYESSCIDENFGIAVDVGTTTIAMQLLSLKTGKVHGVFTGINHQRQYGADVVARIKASTEGKKEELQNCIRKDLKKGFSQLVKEAGVFAEKIKEIVIAGNTTMGHLLMGYDCKSLGVFPFTPVNIRLIEESYKKVFEDDQFSATVRLLPGISAFVGADIMAGVYHCKMHRSEKFSLLIDLGTNGEIVLGNSEKLLAASTAAGPAFEGGNITWGAGSIEGAISSVQLIAGKMQIHTIGGKPPVGICGTGVLEIIAELLRVGVIDETGCLDEKYFEEGYPVAQTSIGEQIVITQKDIREIQLAKAAIRAGIETLILRYGIRQDDISYVYLAGGFGVKLDFERTLAIGLLPKDFKDKIITVGNSSLNGAKKAIFEEDYQSVREVIEKTEEINLSIDKDFNELYIKHICFEQ